MDELFAVEEIIEKMLKTAIEVHCEHSTPEMYFERKNKRQVSNGRFGNEHIGAIGCPKISNGF